MLIADGSTFKSSESRNQTIRRRRSNNTSPLNKPPTRNKRHRNPQRHPLCRRPAHQQPNKHPLHPLHLHNPNHQPPHLRPPPATFNLHDRHHLLLLHRHPRSPTQRLPPRHPHSLVLDRGPHKSETESEYCFSTRFFGG